MRLNSNASREDLQEFCLRLAKVGADLMEIDGNVLRRLGSLPRDLDFIYRINDEADLEIFLNGNYRYCLVCFARYLKGRFRNADMKKKLVVEVKVNSRDEMALLMNGNIDSGGIFGVRLQGLSRLLPHEWLPYLAILREKLRVKIDVCPEDEYKMATATALELAEDINGADFLTASFAGIGGRTGFAALEELLLSLRVIKGMELKGDTGLLSEMGQIYAKLTRQNIPSAKPIIGRDIFNYESGIHADGIRKNPTTYEPYDPAVVGQTRRLVIGKHSGTRALLDKLSELGLTAKTENLAETLEIIREKSASLKRALTDQDVLEIYCGISDRINHGESVAQFYGREDY